MKRKSKMLILIFVLTALPFLLLSSIFYASSVMRDQRAAMEYTLRQTASVIDSELSEVRLLADMLCVNPVVQEYMRTDASAQSKNAQIDEMHTLETVLSHCYQSDAIYDIRIYFANEKFYTSEQISFFPMSAFTKEDRFKNARTIGLLTDLYTRSYKSKNAAQVVTYYRLITDTSALTHTVGALCVDINLSYLTRYLTLPRGTGIQSPALLRPDGSVLLTAEDHAPVYDMSRISLLDAGGHREGMDAVFSVPLAQSSWILAGRIRNAYALFGGASNAAFWVALAILTGLVLCIVLAVSSAFAHRVDELLDLLDPRSGAPVPAVSPVRRTHGMLGTLNHAVLRARELLDYQREQVVRQQQTQLKLLQAQINPHFLYNALDCANWLILNGERERASDMVLSIARYYRFALSKGRDELTVEEDIELAITYARIQECRLRGHIEIHTHVQSAAQGCLVPKMTIQPLVENSIMHGFQKQLCGAQIDIDVYASDGYLCISVSDNGVGMDTDAAANAPFRESPTGGFGLYSVHQRCILFSGDESCGVCIESEKGSYTTVTIRVSLKKQRGPQASP